ncbi:hypothetical protein COM59_24175 [Bacillus pseudomycoides]|uniref:hypothetical protein n=1 Tax=Bacillus pseudomycoides TaxID=64104 RepID=UPI000BF6C6DC|nr:hypothetical protein [Bacillus pseudomycoides]PGF06481.1 hypothetical protein COM59_24175 [Bacillus pseudomycoides]
MDFAESILIDLFKDKFLQIIIRVNCNDKEYPHPLWFNSLEEYYAASKGFVCNDCGASYDWKGAKVGFKRGIYR